MKSFSLKFPKHVARDMVLTISRRVKTFVNYLKCVVSVPLTSANSHIADNVDGHFYLYVFPERFPKIRISVVAVSLRDHHA